MTDVIEDWLFNKVGVTIDLKNDNNKFRDGTLICSILQKHGLLDANFSLNITSSSNKVQCLENLKKLKPLFDMLNVNYDEELILNVVEGNSPAIYKLLYELYVCFENKQHLHFITHHHDVNDENNLIYCSSLDSFKKNLFKSPVLDIRLENASPLIENRDVIDWYRTKYNAITHNMNLRVRKFKNQTLNKHLKLTRNMCNCQGTLQSDTSSEAEILPDFNEFSVSKVDHEKLMSYEEFIISYKEKQQQNKKQKCLENDMQWNLLEETWNKIKDKEKELSNSVFTEMILEQSNYEKQILTKLIQTEQQVKLESEQKSKFNRETYSTDEHHIAMDSNCTWFKEIERMYLEEQKRVQELHKKLYKEKQEHIKKRNYSLCHNIITDLVDIAVHANEYKDQYNVSVPLTLWNNWMKLFFKGQPVHIPFQQLGCDGLNKLEIDYDNIIYLEKLQDDILNESDIEEYLLTLGKWYFRDICLERVNFSQNILAYIVSRLLSTKYPPPPSPLPADLPLYKVAGVLINFSNSEITEKLNNLLAQQNVHVFNPEIAIKKCIDTYKNGQISKVEETLKKKKHKDDTTNGISKSKKKDKMDKSKKMSKNKLDNKKKKTDELLGEKSSKDIINVIDKETQTSIIGLPDDEQLPHISSLDKIGEKILNILEDGGEINDEMMVSIIIEYLKSLEGIEGWILVDFPLNLTQASYLEVALSGKCLPVENYTQHEIETDENIIINDQKEMRKSRLLILPDDLDKTFKTYFTFLIKGKNKNTENEGFRGSNLPNGNSLQIKNSNASIVTERQSLDLLETFYKDQSIFNEFNYDNCDISTLKKLVELIPGVDEISDLIGEKTLKTLTKGKKGKEKKKSIPHVSKKSKKMEINEKGSSLKQLSDEKEKEVIEDTKNISNKEDNDKITQSSLDQMQTKVTFLGDEEWKYISLPLNKELAQILATVWENIENQYLSNLRDIFFENRTINSRLVPYSKYVKERISSIREKPDMRQNLIDIFQNNYNSVASNLRSVTPVKQQLHCGIFQLQQNLWKITDEMKDEIEHERQEIIKDNWLVNEICLLINNYFFLIQTEFDKSIETLKLLYYYYMNMLDRNIPTIINIPNGDFNITRLTTEVFLRQLDKTSLLNSGSRNSYEVSDNFSFETQSSRNNFITKTLVNCEEPQNVIDILDEIILYESKSVKSSFQNVMNYFHKQVYAEAKSIAPSTKRTTKDKTNSKLQNPKKTESKKGKNNGNSSIKENSLQEVSMVELLTHEWELAIDTERDNFSFQLNLIEKRACEDVSDFYCYLKTVFCDLYDSNLKRYDSDISNINKICEFLKTAVEEESVVQQAIILTKDKFFIKTCKNLENRLYPAKDLNESSHDCHFTIHQLNNLKDIFNIAGPYGVIGKQAFCYIFKDLALFNDKDNQPHLPTTWNQLTDSQLMGVIDSLFGPEYGVDWREFIIYNLNIPFPTTDDMLTLRNIFLPYDLEGTEMVSKEDYDNIMLWFEEDLPSNPQESLRLMLIKQLLFELFQTKEKYIKYSALLLYFCKDFDPKKGFAKALSLSIGKHVIINKEELDDKINEENEIIQSVTNLLSDIINSIVEKGEGVLILEMADDTEFSDSEKKPSLAIRLRSESQMIIEDTSKQSSINLSDEPTVLQNSVPIIEELEPNKEVYRRKWVSKIPLTTIESVLNASFHFGNATCSVKKLYLDGLADEADSDKTIEGHVLMSSNCIHKLFAATNKFLISLPCDILQQQLKLTT